MMRSRLVLLLCLIPLLVYELVTFANPTPGDTISETVWQLSKEWPMVPFLFGVVAGHLFWQRKS